MCNFPFHQVPTQILKKQTRTAFIHKLLVKDWFHWFLFLWYIPTLLNEPSSVQIKLHIYSQINFWKIKLTYFSSTILKKCIDIRLLSINSIYCVYSHIIKKNRFFTDFSWLMINLPVKVFLKMCHDSGCFNYLERVGAAFRGILKRKFLKYYFYSQFSCWKIKNRL